jgi:hypothetical protein
MQRIIAKVLAAFAFASFAWLASSAQTLPEEPAEDVVHKSIASIGYTVGDSSKVIFIGTSVAPEASGEAKVCEGYASPGPYDWLQSPTIQSKK